MKKQELLKILEEWKEFRKNKNHELQYYQLAEVIQLVEKLDEPQKVKLPKAAEPWLKHAQYSTDVIDLFSAVEYATDSDGFISENWQWSGDFYDWLSEDADTLYLLCDALRYGYEIEKEPRWVVKDNDGEYVYDLHLYTVDKTAHSSNCSGFDALLFTDKSKAEAVALLVDGSVEEV
ncbi:DUF1642 domain-containing protein [Enterococcus mediterraneensis]|uniref:DUF1642 domain-containing protein n=1 Tax=Enterococcus mediterraneensis TaxID=2364791 RepID=UPI000F055FA2|nr:DUF1642 domain-containing protein [Enterococcus mediterraneensis]